MSKLHVSAALVAMVCLVLATCPACAPPPPEITGLAKVASGNMSDLTCEEIQAVAERLAGASLTDEQAQAVADLLDEYDIDSPSDIEAFIEQAEQGEVPVDQEDLDALRDMFENMDPSEILALLE
jgi:hypothetical protein